MAYGFVLEDDYCTTINYLLFIYNVYYSRYERGGKRKFGLLGAPEFLRAFTALWEELTNDLGRICVINPESHSVVDWDISHFADDLSAPPLLPSLFESNEYGHDLLESTWDAFRAWWDPVWPVLDFQTDEADVIPSIGRSLRDMFKESGRPAPEVRYTIIVTYDSIPPFCAQDGPCFFMSPVSQLVRPEEWIVISQNIHDSLNRFTRQDTKDP